MKRIWFIFLLPSFLCTNEVLAQKLILTPNEMRSSDNPSSLYVEYSYRNGVGKNELRSYCIQNLGQPDFFSYRVDYTDDSTIKLSGFVKKNLKGVKFNMLFGFDNQKVRVSSELFDKEGLTLDCREYYSKKGKLKDKKFKAEVERRLDEIIRSLMEMKIVMH